MNGAGANFDAELAPPHAASLAESLRAFGYELATALADLADNSLFHRARRIQIHFHWAGPESIIALADDGNGMDEATLVNAMRVGSRNPREARDPADLGRFGLGLKTASFSQCRRVTVFTHRKGEEIVARCWDLDHIAETNEWQLLRIPTPIAKNKAVELGDSQQGTVVVWEKLDRLTAATDREDDTDEDAFLRRAENVGEYFAVVFHRLMIGRRAVVFLLNGRPIKPWDPFLADEPATQRLPLEKLPFQGCQIEVEPFVLPHLSKLDAETHHQAGGLRGWNAHQGFYIYRNRRLLVAGDWLGIKGWRQEEHYKLARIRVDLPNTLDHEWEIDVTKSRARPPEKLRKELARIGERTRSIAKRVYSYRGAKLIPSETKEKVFIWEQTARHNRVFYRLNRDHPLIKHVRTRCADVSNFTALLRLIEETIPVPLITITDREKPDQTVGPFETAKESEILEVMRQVLAALRAGGLSHKDALLRLSHFEPFPRFPELLQTIREEDADEH
ncbi:MAG TPA: ATP-binding protein [Sedimentisphaerales bacterium]|nr:ATP-binding protein [Sedimentisphaerales bacterium]